LRAAHRTRRRSAEARCRSGKLAKQFEAAFWCPQLQTYALALDGSKEPCAVRTSNAGQVLFTGIADPARAALVAKGLLRSDFFSGWGIRTVARGEARYNPMSYHNGSIWPHDNALIGLGLARYGLKQSVETLFTGLFHAVACTPQAWASATPFALLQASLGLEFDPFQNEIRLCNPRLPAFLDEVMLRNLQLGSSRIDLRVRRHNDTVSLDTPRIDGGIRVSVVYSS
jgi:glycogen debranching enzyme